MADAQHRPRGPVAGYRPVPAREYGGEHPSVAGDHGVPNCVDASMQEVEATDREPVLDRPAPEADAEELVTGDDSVLPFGKGSYLEIQRSLGACNVHITLEAPID